MSDTPPSAPSPDEFPPEEILLGRLPAWILTGLFLLLLAIPPVLDGLPQRLTELAAAITGKASNKPVAERLRAYDSSIAAASFTDAPRQFTQQILTTLLEKGNDRVVIGKDGWLFYRPEVQALTGYGPLDPEPHSVSRDPALLDWEAPLGPIVDFSRQLSGKCIPELAAFRPILMIVPVPMKPSIYPEKLTGRPSASPIPHRDRFELYQRLAASGIRVLDLMPLLWAGKADDPVRGPLYLKDDTHWTTRGMTLAAEAIGDEVIQGGPFGLYDTNRWGKAPLTLLASASGHGDLVEKLGLQFPDRWQPARMEPLAVVEDSPEMPSFADPNSPVVLLGDSFVNIFDDPGLGFRHPDARSRTQAGLARHLAAKVGIPLDVHAVNGEGASGVRRWLAQRGDEVLRSKKLVIWVIAERDLFLSRSVAKANRVTWDRVSFAAAAPTPSAAAADLGPSVVEAEVIEKSEQADPRRANYQNALFTVQYRIRRTVSGSPVTGDIEVVHWHFKERILQPASGVAIGQVYRLTLLPWAAQADLQPINRGELGEAAPAWWSAGAEPVR